MTPVDQTILGDAGNCLSAALASVLDLPIEAVPYLNGSRWAQRMFSWLSTERRLWPRWIPVSAGVPAGYSIAVGPGPRGRDHATVALDGRLVHDPHPSRAGLLRPTHHIVLIPL